MTEIPRKGRISAQDSTRPSNATGVGAAAFTGSSYLTHPLGNWSAGAIIGLRARTLAPNGLLFYAQTTSRFHMALYLHDGLLRFLFSCGLQTMLFSELEDRVNDGFPLNIVAILEMVPGEPPQCAATLRLNESLAMSGEQKAPKPDQLSTMGTPPVHAYTLHLGGLPPHLKHFIDLPITEGIVGCMDTLEIDGESRHIYLDAKDGFGVSECASLSCLSSPCRGGATCIETGDRRWSCLCPSGYVGDKCDRSVCGNNPCRFGGTCAEYPGSGFICLCPFGKHGLFCQNDLEVGQPSYWPSVGGYSSYTAYPLPGAVHHSFEVRFRFSPASTDQIGLMLFIGQGRSHDPTSDHLAVSFIKGYVVLTWNLGSGPRRIFTPRSLAGKPGRTHSVRLGRTGQQAWLQVDNMENVTGHSPGRLSQLNTQAVMFVGGHRNVNFTGLPHDLPLHTGFSGCIHGVEVRTGRVSVPVGRLGRRAISGRGVGQCGTHQCHNTTCLHGGACLDHGSTFTCLCKSGWFGPVCALSQNPCDSTHHNCTQGSTCVPLESGYICDCPLGRSGVFCEKVEKLSDVSLSGLRSFLSLPAADLHLQQTCLDFELRPLKNSGLVAFSGEGSQTYFALSLHGGVLELRVLPAGGGRRPEEPVVVRSGRVVALGAWHRVRAGRYGQRLFLWIDGSVNAGALRFGETILPTTSPLYIGGVPDLSDLPPGAVSDLPVPFVGCVRRMSVNWKHVSLDENGLLSARNIADCDGTPCGGDVCRNGGTCWLDTALRPHCTCPTYYTGRKCESTLTCAEAPCQNGGRCVREGGEEFVCKCPAGRGGPFCEKEAISPAAHFSGDSFMVIDADRYTPGKRDEHSAEQRSRRNEIDFIYLNFTTYESDGMILWSSMGDEFVGIGLRDGVVRIAWAWEGLAASVASTPEIQLDDGNWHDILLAFTTENVTLRVDFHLYTFETATGRPISSDGVIYLGGFPQETDIEVETHGFFRTRFIGCVRELVWTDHHSVTDFGGYLGENVGTCTEDIDM